MVTKDDVIGMALSLGFEDVGFTTADVFSTHREILLKRREEYGWAARVGLDLLAGTDPKTVLPGRPDIYALPDRSRA